MQNQISWFLNQQKVVCCKKRQESATGGVLKESSSEIFWNIHEKTPALESLIKQAWRHPTLL